MSDTDEIQYIKAKLQEFESKQNSKLTEDDYLAKLKEKVNSLLDKSSTTFEVGKIVKWKKGLKNRKYPKEDQLCMVVEVLDPPKQGEKDPGSPYFGEPLNLVLALLDDEKKDLLIFHYDKRRFEIVEENKLVKS